MPSSAVRSSCIEGPVVVSLLYILHELLMSICTHTALVEHRCVCMCSVHMYVQYICIVLVVDVWGSQFTARPPLSHAAPRGQIADLVLVRRTYVPMYRTQLVVPHAPIWGSVPNNKADQCCKFKSPIGEHAHARLWLAASGS